MKAHIKAISYYLPEYQLDNKVIEQEFPEWSIDKIASKTGIHCRNISAKEETSVDMAVKAAEKLFEEHQNQLQNRMHDFNRLYRVKMKSNY